MHTVKTVKTEMADDDASIQVLEPDVDQQYIPERRERAAKPKLPVKNVDSNWQKPPLLIVERQVVPPRAEEEKKEEEEVAARIVNIVDEQQKKTNTVWKTRLSDIVWFIIKFFLMSFFAFVVLVLLNPPFVQESQPQQLFGDNTPVEMQRRSASLSRSAGWAAGAGAAFVLLPSIWDVVSSRFFPNDILTAIGLK